MYAAAGDTGAYGGARPTGMYAAAGATGAYSEVWPLGTYAAAGAADAYGEAGAHARRGRGHGHVQHSFFLCWNFILILMYLQNGGNKTIVLIPP